MLAPTVQVPVRGFQISAGWIALAGSQPMLVPPVTTTWPAGITVACDQWRRYDIDAVSVTTGVVPLMSITLASGLARFGLLSVMPLPPTCRMRPGSNITAELVKPTFGVVPPLLLSCTVLKVPMRAIVPLRPLSSGSILNRMFDVMPKTEPSAAIHARG